MKKIKKPVSILLVFMMIVSLFAIVPISAGAANLTGTVDMSELQVGDIITVDVTITNNNGYELKLPSGKIFCESWDDLPYTDVLDHDVILISYSFSEGLSGIQLKDDNADATTYYPVNKDGYGSGPAFIVTAVDSDFSTVTIETPTYYTVKWKNYDGNVLHEQDVIKGETPSHPNITPTKPADANHVYTFSGWSPELSPVTADTSYTAQFTSSPIPSDYQSPAISDLWVGDSAEVTATGVINGTGGTGTASVSQEGDYTVLTLDNFSYTGVGSTYDNNQSPVIYLGNYPLIVRLIGTNVLTQTGTTGDYNGYGFYNANYNSNVVEVRFEGSGKLTVSSGDSEKNTVGVQTGGRLTLSECTLNAKAGSTDYTYATSAGVSSEGDTVIENGAKLTAAGGSVVGDNPHSNGANAFSYLWGTADIILKSGSVSLSGETSAIYYYADDYRDYIRVADGSTLKALKAGDSEGSAVDVALDAIANQKYIYAEVDAPAPTTYTVTWKNGDTVLETDTVEEGNAPAYTGTVPEKAEDANYTYTFSGWSDGTNTYGASDTLPEVTGDITYTAQYTATAKTFKAYVKKLTGGTYTLENLTGETTVAQLKEIIADQIDIPATAQRLIFAGKELDDAKTLAEYNIGKESTIHLIIRGYTVTWKNGDTVLKTDTVEGGTAPAYTGTVPEKAEDENNTYTFSGWTDGTNTYGASDTLPTVTADVTYTATFAAEDKAVKNVIALINALPAAAEIIAADKAQIEAARAAYEALNGDQKALISTETLDKLTAAEAALAAAEKLFAAHSVTLGGNIGVNFFINSKTVDFANADTAVVKFTWDDGKYNEEVNLKELTLDANGYYKASVDVVAAQIAHKIHAEVYLNGEKLDPTDNYSVQDYAEAVYNNPAKYDREKPGQLRALAKALLNYGANAQTVFDSALTEKPALANANVGNNGYADVTAEQIAGKINGTASDLNAIATRLGAKYFTSSLIYLSKNTLRIYFTPTSYPGEIPNANAYDGSKSDHYYYVDHANIPAAELDDQQTFNVNGTTFTFSALDYAKAVVESTKMDDNQKNLAKSLYLYNQAANDYFV